MMKTFLAAASGIVSIALVMLVAWSVLRSPRTVAQLTDGQLRELVRPLPKWHSTLMSVALTLIALMLCLSVFDASLGGGISLNFLQPAGVMVLILSTLIIHYVYRMRALDEAIKRFSPDLCAEISALGPVAVPRNRKLLIYAVLALSLPILWVAIAALVRN